MQLKSQYQELEWQTREGFSDDGYVTNDVTTSLLVYCIKAVLSPSFVPP